MNVTITNLKQIHALNQVNINTDNLHIGSKVHLPKDVVDMLFALFNVKFEETC